MRTTFSESFKYNVVEKAVNRTKEVTIYDIAKVYGIAHSTVGRGIRELRHPTLGNETAIPRNEKHPADWPMA